jgi:hypothetical protein
MGQCNEVTVVAVSAVLMTCTSGYRIDICRLSQCEKIAVMVKYLRYWKIRKGLPQRRCVVAYTSSTLYHTLVVCVHVPRLVDLPTSVITKYLPLVEEYVCRENHLWFGGYRCYYVRESTKPNGLRHYQLMRVLDVVHIIFNSPWCEKKTKYSNLELSWKAKFVLLFVFD